MGGDAKISLDTDWIYRRALPRIVGWVRRVGGAAWTGVVRTLQRSLEGAVVTLMRHHGPQGILARTWPTGSMVLWVAVILAGSLLLYYL